VAVVIPTTSLPYSAYAENDSLRLKVAALEAELAAIRAMPFVPATEHDRVLRQRDRALEAARSVRAGDYELLKSHYNAANERMVEAAHQRDKLEAALGDALGQRIGDTDTSLADVMRARYGREAAQWKANHEERKKERDTAIQQRNDALKLADELTRQLANQSDKRLAVMLDRALASVAALVRQLDRIKGHSTHAEQGDLRLARALLVEAGR
jgi:hypothetical protein